MDGHPLFEQPSVFDVALAIVFFPLYLLLVLVVLLFPPDDFRKAISDD